MLTGLLVREPMPAYGKLRVYADTSVIGGCEDDEFRDSSRRLIDQCARGEMTLVVSSVTERELATAPRAVREVIGALGDLPEVRRIRQYSEANRRMGYPPVEIRTPKELEHEE